MQISQALADAFAAHRGLDPLTAQLRTAGHLSASQGLQVDGRMLVTSDAAGNPLELSSAAQALVTAFVPPAAPASPNYGADLMTDDDLQAVAAVLTAQLRAYIALPTPSAAQRKAWEDGISKIAVYLLHYRFPQL
jgi:hypothetical protein